MAVDLAFTETGTGPPLVVLHGLFGSRRNWAAMARILGRGHRVIVADLRNHGDSPWDPRIDYPALADDVARLIESVAGGRAAVLGHSMGGKVAMTLALERPQVVERLVVVDIAPVASRGTPIEFVRAMRALPLGGLSRRSEVADALAHTVADPAVRNFLALNARPAGDGLEWAVNLEAIEREFDTILGFPDLAAGRVFSGPALFLAGERSSSIGPEHVPVIERLFPTATIETIAGAGHWVHADAPEAFVATVERFLAG